MQVLETFQSEDHVEETEAWVDVVTVSVPARTHRRTVIAKAVAAMDMAGERYLRVRVIPLEHATPIKVTMEPQPPQLRIGE